MSVRAVDPARSRIVLVGAPVYDDPQLADVPQIANNLTDLVSVFTDAKLGGFPAEHCLVAPPNASVDQVGDLLETAAEAAEDLLLFYFAGHGLIGPRGDLFLALRGTRSRNPAYSSLRFDTVRDTFLDMHTKAKNRAAIIDSCFSGRAIGHALSGNLADGLEIRGSYTLASAPPNSSALVLDGEEHTAFTGRLLELLRDGDPRSGDLISLREIYRHLHTQLRADGLPLPQVRGTATADSLGLVRNVRPAPVVPEPLPHAIRTLLDSGIPRARQAGVEELADWFSSSDPRRTLAARLALEEVIARDIQPVADAARQVLGTSSGTTSAGTNDNMLTQRAVALLYKAEGAVPAIKGRGIKAKILAEIAELLAAIDSQAALRIADKAQPLAIDIIDASIRSEVLATIAGIVVATDPDRADRLTADIERRVFRLTDPGLGAWRSADVANALNWDNQRAVRMIAHADDLANTIADPGTQANVLARMALTTANIGLKQETALLAERVEELTKTILDPIEKGRAMAITASALARTDTQHAARAASQAGVFANSIPDGQMKSFILAFMAVGLAATDPQRARRLTYRARHLIDLTAEHDDLGTSILFGIGTAMAMLEPERAEAFADSIADNYARANTLVTIARVYLKGPHL